MGKKNVTGVKVVETRLGDPDETGRLITEAIADTEEIIDADVVIIACGYLPNAPDWVNEFDILKKSNSCIKVKGEKKFSISNEQK